MTLDKVIHAYKELIDTESKVVSNTKKNIFTVGSLRLIIVALCFVACYLLWGSTGWIASSIIATIVIFLSLVKVHTRLHILKRYSELKIKNAKDELGAIDYDFSPFDGAPEKIDSDHSFSYDLDIFGKKSFFQSINRTVTKYGKNKLADTILHPFERKEDIYTHQEIIKTFSNNFNLLAHYRATGQMQKTDDIDIKQIINNFVGKSLTNPFSNSFWKYMLYIIPCVALSLITITALGIISSGTCIIGWTVLIAISSIPMKNLKNNMSFWDKTKDNLLTYSQLFKIMESNIPENSPVFSIKEIKNKNIPSKAIAELGQLVDNFYQSFTFPGILFLSPALLWNVRYAIKIEKWVMEHKEDINIWFDELAQFDSLISLATYAHNHPSYIYPEVVDNLLLQAEQLGHPMINRDKCVRNDVAIGKHPYFLIVTGANMAGKSTYLRTVGLNLTLASIGVPVYADSFKFSPFKLITNLRTSDSLADSESYFFAELKRLKMIIDRLQNGELLFIILDEILKGTNSEDKQKGSIALMKQLIAESGCGIIATHDLILGNLESEFPNEVKNYRFEAVINNDQLSFSYKIQEGIAQNMNACFLMKKMGITGL